MRNRHSRVSPSIPPQRRRLSLHIWLPLILSLATIAPSRPCHMCFCGVPSYPTVAEAVRQSQEDASAVLLGQVNEVENDPADTTFSPSGVPRFDRRRPVVYHLKVLLFWKGQIGNGRLSEVTADALSPCALRLTKDSTYLIYASAGEDGRLYGNSCNRVLVGDSAAADMRLLGKDMILNSGH